MPHWTVNAREAGARLDKFLAGADRIGSRVRAATALERGKVFLNEREMTLDRRRRAGWRRAMSFAPGWTGRAARSAAPRSVTIADLPIVYEDDTLIVLEQAGRTAGRAAAAAAARRRALGVRRSEGVPAPPRPPPAVRRPPHRSRHVGPGRVREDRPPRRIT